MFRPLVSDIIIPVSCPRCQTPLLVGKEQAHCGSCGLRLWRDVPVLRLRYWRLAILFTAYASVAMAVAGIWFWIRFPSMLPYFIGLCVLEVAAVQWVAYRRKEYVGVVSPDGLFAIEGKKLVSSIPWAAVTGFKRGRWPWQVQVLTSAQGVHDVGPTINLWTPRLARGFVRVAEEVRRTKLRRQ